MPKRQRVKSNMPPSSQSSIHPLLPDYHHVLNGDELHGRKRQRMTRSGNVNINFVKSSASSQQNSTSENGILSSSTLPEQSQLTEQSFNGLSDNPQLQELHQGINDGKNCNNEFVDLQKFVLFIDIKMPIASYNILKVSSQLNYMKFDCTFENLVGFRRCILKLGSHELVDLTGEGENGVPVRKAAADQAVDKLINMCWILLDKGHDFLPKISKCEMTSEENATSESIANNNVGYKMLQKMGWAGGGMGKHGSGIAEPITVNTTTRREGLGSEGNVEKKGNFKKRVRAVLHNYSLTDNQEDLVFTAEFDGDDRKIIHEIAEQLKLVSKSRGKEDDRYIAVGRKKSLNILMNYVRAAGGETSQYRLLPPGSSVQVEEFRKKKGMMKRFTKKRQYQESTECQELISETCCANCQKTQNLIKSLESSYLALEKRLHILEEERRNPQTEQRQDCNATSYNWNSEQEETTVKNVSQDIQENLQPVLDMAKCYSKMTKDSLDSLVALERCAARAKLKMRSAAKTSVNSKGAKQITCEVFANDIKFASIHIKSGTDPDDAKRKLAVAVLEKISLSHLRLVAGDGGGFVLEGSSSPFAEDVVKSPATCDDASTT